MSILRQFQPGGIAERRARKTRDPRVFGLEFSSGLLSPSKACTDEMRKHIALGPPRRPEASLELLYSFLEGPKVSERPPRSPWVFLQCL